MDPIIEEICRVKRHEPVQQRVLWRWQDHLRDVVQPQLDELAALKAQHGGLIAERASVEAEPVRRGPGRPRKTAEVA